MKPLTLGPFQSELKVVETATDEFPAGSIEGYASVFGNVDLGGDVVMPGAFTKTLKENIPLNRVKFVDSHNVHEGTKAIIGTIPSAKEDKHGLFFKARLSGVQAAQDVRQKVKEGILDSLSFGYSTIKSEPGDGDLKGSRLLKELKLYEISVVAWGMNPVAAITGAKGIVGLVDLTLAPAATAWDATTAKKNLVAQIGGDPTKWTTAEWERYQKAFLWHDSSNPQEFSSYALPVADVVGGSLSYVWSGVHAALASVRGATDGPWSAEKAAIETELKKLYEKFGQPFPEKGIGSADFADSAIDAEVKVLLASMTDMLAKQRMHQLIASMRAK